MVLSPSKVIKNSELSQLLRVSSGSTHSPSVEIWPNGSLQRPGLPAWCLCASLENWRPFGLGRKTSKLRSCQAPTIWHLLKVNDAFFLTSASQLDHSNLENLALAPWTSQSRWLRTGRRPRPSKRISSCTSPKSTSPRAVSEASSGIFGVWSILCGMWRILRFVVMVDGCSLVPVGALGRPVQVQGKKYRDRCDVLRLRLVSYWGEIARPLTRQVNVIITWSKFGPLFTIGFPIGMSIMKWILVICYICS
jgi:hypothetical protein